MDLCREWGCLAVQFGIDGEAEHVYPLRPDALEQAVNDYRRAGGCLSTPCRSCARMIGQVDLPLAS